MTASNSASVGSQAGEPEVRRRRWFLMPLVVLALGIISIGLLIFTNWIRQRLVTQDTALHRAVGEVQTRLSTAHLWLEEFVSGDSVDLDEISYSLERAEVLVDAMMYGGETGPYRLDAVTDQGLIESVQAIAPQIRRFAEMSEERESGFRVGDPVGIGSVIDGEYDRAYNILLADLRELDAVVGQRLNAAHARSELLFRTILVAWVVIVVLAVTGLSRLEIKGRAAERALRESEAQLRQAQKMEAVGRLAGGMAHDINNYLAAITAQCELVLMTSDAGDPVRQRMDRVLTTSSKAAALIERLLSFSRQKPVKPEVLNVNRSVEDLMRLVERLIGEDVRLETRLTGELWNVEVDPTQIEQVVLNLVVNAREAMPTGGRVLIETSNRTFRPADLESLPIDRPGDYVVLSMTDTGVGVPEEMRERIFEPFVTTKDTGSQSGLGLAMVYAIANQNGGGVAAYSGEGQGATFKFYLPRSRTLTVTKEKVVAGKIEVPRGTQHLLMVEDNSELREAVSEALHKLGYTVSIASNAEEALEVVDSLDSVPDLLVSDVVMPGMNGRELWEALIVRYPSLEVIFISGYTDDVVLRHGIEQGEYRFLQKPFSIDELAITIASVFE